MPAKDLETKLNINNKEELEKSDTTMVTNDKASFFCGYNPIVNFYCCYNNRVFMLLTRVVLLPFRIRCCVCCMRTACERVMHLIDAKNAMPKQTHRPTLTDVLSDSDTSLEVNIL